MKKIAAGVLALWIGVVSVVTPGRVLAQSQVLASAVGVLSAVSSSGVVTRGVSLLAGPWGGAAAFVVGAVIAGIYWTGSDGQTINVLPKSKASTLAADLATSAALPFLVDYLYKVDANPCSVASSYAAACSGFAACALPSGGTKSCGAGTTSGTTCTQPVGIYPSGSCPHASWNMSMSKTCPSGYSDNGAQCQKVVASGSVAGQLPQTEGYKYPDVIGGQPVLRDVVTAAPKSIVQDKAVPVAGNPNQTIQVTPTADGGIQITRRTFDAAKGTTTIETVQTDAAGKVVSNAATEAAGNVIGGSSVAMSIEFPTDYNREATQSSILEQTTGARTEIKTDREQASAKATEIAATVAAATAAAGSPGDPGGSWNVPGLGLPSKDQFQVPDVNVGEAVPASTGSCQVITLDFLGRSMALNPCPVVAVMSPIINWAVVLIAGIASVQWILGRREES